MSLNKTLIENLTHPLISREKMLRPTLLATLINLTRLKKKIHLKKKIALEIFKITHLLRAKKLLLIKNNDLKKLYYCYYY